MPLAMTPSALAYLFGDRWAPENTSILGETVPSSSKVSCMELVAGLLEVAVWNLREQRLLELAVGSRGVAVRLVGGGERPGLEGALVSARKPDDLYGMVLDVGGGGYPWRRPARLCRQETIDAGLVKLEGRIRRRPVVADEAAVRALEPAYEDLTAKLRFYREAEPELQQAILRECVRAIERYQQTSG